MGVIPSLYPSGVLWMSMTSLPAGVPATLVLVATLVVAGVVGILVYRRKTFDDPNVCSRSQPTRRMISAHAFGVLAVAPVFWVWAVVHCIQGSFDLGAVSFLFAIGAAIRGNHVSGSSDLGAIKVYRVVITGGCLCPFINYLLGVVVVDSPTTMAYFLLSAGVWLGAAVMSLQHTTRLVDMVTEQGSGVMSPSSSNASKYAKILESNDVHV